MTTQNTQTGTARFFVPTTRRQWMYVIAAGLAAGIVAWLGGILLTLWVFTPLFCQATDSIALCATTEFAGTHTATIFAIVVGSIILANTTKQGLAGTRTGSGLCRHYEDCHAIDVAGRVIIATWNMSLFFVVQRR